MGLLVLGDPGRAGADPRARSTANLDGWYVTLGPGLSATRIEDTWFTMAGGEVSLVRVSEQCVPAAVGLAAGGSSYAGRAGGRLYVEAELAVKRPLPFAVGLAGGVTAEVDGTREPRYGWQATLYVFAGVVPYVRTGQLQEAGSFVEAGLLVKLPALRFH